MHILDTSSKVTLEERRAADGLDAYVPRILCDGELYDADVDRFFLDLPLNGVRSRHSLRAYGYDIMVWLRFLTEVCDKTVWEAARADVEAFHRIRRRGEPGIRISAASWNRSIAAIDKLYEWGVREGLLPSSPFSHREIWRRNRTRGQGKLITRNDAFEGRANQNTIRFVTLEDFRQFRDVGLRGLSANGAERPGARDRNGLRNALFAEMLVVTGLRLEEASFLLVFELDALPAANASRRQTWLNLPAGLTKGERGRAILIPDGLLQRLQTYIRVERTHAVTKFKAREGWNLVERPILVRRPTACSGNLLLVDGRTVPLEVFSPDERERLVICNADSTPIEPAVLWVTEVGQPVRPNSWEVAFARACHRCQANGLPIDISPHQLRHTFAVHMLAMLIQRQLDGGSLASSAGPAEGYRRILGDPLQQVQRLLGHASLETTSIYLDHIATRADTVDTAVAELLALLPGGGPAMSQHPRKGRAVSFNRELAISPCDEPETVTGLRFIIDTQDGSKVLIDYAHLAPRWLAIAFARALRRLAGLGGRLSVKSTVTDYVRILPMFLTYLVETKNEPDAADRLRADHIDGFEAWLAEKGKSNIHLLFILTKIIVALREVASEGTVAFDEQLRDRLAYVTLRPIPPSHPRDAYSPYIARQLRDAARADIMAIVQRLRDPKPMNSYSGLLAMEKEIHSHIGAKGIVRHTDPKYHVLNDARRVHGLSSERLCHQLHERHYLTSHDIIPLLVFLALETGLEPECCKSLRVDCLRNPANGTVEIAYVKRRARGAEHKTLRVRDGGPRTPGGLIRQIIAWTAAARKHRPTDCLWLYYGFGALKSGVNHPQHRIDAWTVQHNIRDDDGRPFHLTLSRLRKTHKALWYLKTEGHMTRFSVGHTKEVAARHYADIPSLRPLHEATIADAFTEAFTSALSSTVLTPEEEETWRNDPGTALEAAPVGCDPISLLDGRQDIWLASCGGFFSSPYADPGSPCSQPFWGCLECPNAVITARKLPAILSFLAFLEDQRLSLSAGHWAAKFATAHARITMQILPAFGAATVEEARRVLASEPVSNYMPPEALQ